MKKTYLFLVLGVLLLMSIVFVFARPTCIDRDGGLVYDVFGLVFHIGGVDGDYCFDSNTLVERFCFEERLSSEIIDCSHGCEDGACLPCTPETCSSLGYECGSHSDGCGGTLNCGGCSGDDACVEGTCVVWCQDDDPTNNVFAFGTTINNNNGYAFEDQCNSIFPDRVDQYYCRFDVGVIGSSTTTCSNGCSNGVCL